MVLSPGTRADHQHEGSRSRQEEAPSGHDSRVAVPQAFMTSLLGMWTQSDSTLRRGAIEDLFRPDAHFHDKDGAYVGYEALETSAIPCNRASPEHGLPSPKLPRSVLRSGPPGTSGRPSVQPP